MADDGIPPQAVWSEDVLRFNDTDALGHVNNAVFATLAESGRMRVFREHLDAHLAPGAFWVIARLVIEFRAELLYPGRVRVATWVSRIGRTSLTLAQGLVAADASAAAGPPAATMEGICVLLDGATRRPLPLPEGARRAAARLLPEAGPAP